MRKNKNTRPVKELARQAKGITLVALIITIIVLLILAIVSIRLVMNDGIIDRANRGTQRYSEEETGEQIKLAYLEWQMHQLSNETPQKTAQDFMQEKLRETLKDNGLTVTEASGSYTITCTDEKAFSFNPSTGKTEPVTSSGGGSSTSVAYEVGDVVRLGGEDFYVIERSDATKTTVKLLAKYNVKTESGEGQYTQKSDANTLAFDDESNVYYDDTTNPVTEAEIKTHVDAYKTALEGRMGSGKTIQEARLMLKEEVEALGGDADNITTEGCPEFINEQAYWLGSPYENDTDLEWVVRGDHSYFYDYYVLVDYYYGLRPVVIVLKSNI